MKFIVCLLQCLFSKTITTWPTLIIFYEPLLLWLGWVCAMESHQSSSWQSPPSLLLPVDGCFHCLQIRLVYMCAFFTNCICIKASNVHQPSMYKRCTPQHCKPLYKNETIKNTMSHGASKSSLLLSSSCSNEPTTEFVPIQSRSQPRGVSSMPCGLYTCRFAGSTLSPFTWPYWLQLLRPGTI